MRKMLITRVFFEVKIWLSVKILMHNSENLMIQEKALHLIVVKLSEHVKLTALISKPIPSYSIIMESRIHKISRFQSKKGVYALAFNCRTRSSLHDTQILSNWVY